MTTKIDELDRLNLLFSMEKVAHLETKLREMQLAFNITKSELAQAQKKREILSAEISAKYKLAPGDALDPETGDITRANEDPHDQASRSSPVAPN